MAHICKTDKMEIRSCVTLKCGSCLNEFSTICLLHEHLIGMSYTYVHTEFTAYPKFDFKCKSIKPKVLTLKTTAADKGSKKTEFSVESQPPVPDITDNNEDQFVDDEKNDTETNVKIVDQGSKELVKCDQCGVVIQRGSLRKHVLRHSSSRSFVCDKCAKPFVTATELKMHVLGVHERGNQDYMHTCEKCSKKFVSKFLLHKHLEKHGERRFKCHFCLKDFTWNRSLRKHVTKEHDSSYVPQFTCYICRDTFTTKQEVEDHKRLKHSQPELACSHCLRMFKDKCSLRRHVKTHTGDKVYKCNYCGHGFIQINPYYAHMLKRHSISKTDAYSLHLSMNDKHFDEPLPPSVQEVPSYIQGDSIKDSIYSQIATKLTQDRINEQQVENEMPSRTAEFLVADNVYTAQGPILNNGQHMSQIPAGGTEHSSRMETEDPIGQSSHAASSGHQHQPVCRVDELPNTGPPQVTQHWPTYVPDDGTHILYQVEMEGDNDSTTMPGQTQYVQVSNEPIEICLQNGDHIDEIRIINVQQ